MCVGIDLLWAGHKFSAREGDQETMQQTINDSSVKANIPVLLQPEIHNKKYETLFVEIDTGQIKLPMFQREFVWDKEQSAKLIDSFSRGFLLALLFSGRIKREAGGKPAGV
jgi:hypothetical protein